MRTAPRSTRHAAAQLSDKENLVSTGVPATKTASSNKKSRHRVSTAELAKLEGMFRRVTHPSRQQKKDLATELGMDYKTVTIWFQNKRQSSKRGRQHSAEKLVKPIGSADASRLRSVSSPLHNATLDLGTTETFKATEEAKAGMQVLALDSSLGSAEGLSAMASMGIVQMKPLLDSMHSLNALTSRSRERSEATPVKAVDGALNSNDSDPHLSWLSEDDSAETSRYDQTAEQEQNEEKSTRWKRIRTLEWACERQAKRYKSSREGFVRLESEELSDDDVDDRQMDSALTLLSLAPSTLMGPSRDVMRGASLLLSFKHSWRRK